MGPTYKIAVLDVLYIKVEDERQKGVINPQKFWNPAGEKHH